MLKNHIPERIFEVLKDCQFDPDLDSYRDELIESAAIHNFPVSYNEFLEVVDISTCSIVSFSDNFENIMGCNPGKFNLQLFYNRILFKDRIEVINATAYALKIFTDNFSITPLKTTFEIDFTIKKCDKTRIRLLRNSSIYKKDKKGFPVLFLNSYTDITNQKDSIQINVSSAGPEKHLFDYEVSNTFCCKDLLFSSKDIEIMYLLEKDHVSKTIAVKLQISKSTVDTHCRRMLRKTGFTKMTSVIAFARRKGYIF
jgi:DNA-binding CsgD family transcriptional regulator